MLNDTNLLSTPDTLGNDNKLELGLCWKRKKTGHYDHCMSLAAEMF
jgi:hypothetical protein